MIIPATKKIMIIPDFGTDAEAGDMLALKEAIEKDKDFSVKIVDLRNEIQREGLKDSQIIEACARRLEELAEDKEPEKINERRVSHGRLTITVYHAENDEDESAPNLIVVFGKSAMLAGGVRHKKILFINPEYDSEWPWKKQYYADRNLAKEFMSEFMDEIREPDDTYLYDGAETNRSNISVTRFALQTEGEKVREFSDRYPWLSMRDASIGNDTEKLAQAIREFADSRMEFPHFDIYEMWQDSWSRNRKSTGLPLPEPLKLNRMTVTGLTRGVPMANGQSGMKLNTEGRSYPIPFEAVNDRQELTLLRDAVKETLDLLPPKKRILIVPDYFIPYDAPHIVELREQLRRRGYYVAVVAAGDTLEKTRIGIERRCKMRPFDLIVTLENGCLLAARIRNTPRIFVNPDWDAAWKWMKTRLGDKREVYETRGMEKSGPFYTFRINANEVIEARKMGERSYIRRDGELAVGWFTHDEMDSDLPEEHMKRFDSAAYTPIKTLADEDGIYCLAKEIDKFLKNLTDED